MLLRKKIYRSLLLFLITATDAPADMNFGRDAVNANENNWNNYTKVENIINFTQLLKMLSNVTSRSLVRASANISNEITTAISQVVKNSTNQLVSTVMQTTRDAYQATRDATTAFVHENRWRLIGLLAGSGYCYLTYTIISLRLYFNQKERWLYWNDYLTLEALCATSQKDLGVELIKEIQRRYTSISAPTDFVTPLIRFLQLIDEEQQRLELYLKLGPWLTKLHLCTITGYSTELAQKCESWRRRVAYLRATFMRWMAEYKIEQNTGTTRSLIDERFPFLQFIAQRSTH